VCIVSLLYCSESDFLKIPTSFT